MTEPNRTTASWPELIDLLEPIHGDVQLFARRIARSNPEGDDLFQEAMMRAAHKIGALRDRSKFRAWIFGVVVSVHRTRWRRSVWRRWMPWESAPEAVGDDGTRWENSRASAGRAAAALATLPPPQREAIVLFELHGYSIDEIADVQRTSMSSVKSRLQRGRDRLRQFYAAVGLPISASLTDTKEVCRG